MRRLLVVPLLLLACFAPPALGAGYNGISDQNAATFSGPVVGLLPNVSRARLIVSWDIATNPANRDELTKMIYWLAAVQAHGYVPTISFAASNASDADALVLPASNTTYRTAIQVFRYYFPDIAYYTAWNEPNHPVNFGGKHQSSYLNPTAAAHYWNVLSAECRTPSRTGKTCLVGAGDFSDAEGSSPDWALLKYTAAYKSVISTVNPPTRWAVHTYYALKYQTSTQMDQWLNAIPSGGLVWFTEGGGFYCQRGVTYGETSQFYQAAYLPTLEALDSRISQAFYYYLQPGSSSCGSNTFDTALLRPDGVARAAFWAVYAVR